MKGYVFWVVVDTFQIAVVILFCDTRQKHFCKLFHAFFLLLKSPLWQGFAMWVAFHRAKINFSEFSVNSKKEMERSGPRGNFPVKVIHLQRWSSLTVRSGGPKIDVPWFKKILVSSPTLPNSNQNCGRNANELLRFETLIQLSNVVPFSLDNSTGFWMFGLAKWKAPMKTDHHPVDLGGIVCKPQ